MLSTGVETILQAAKKMEKELRLQIERLQEDKNYNDQMYREVCSGRTVSLDIIKAIHLDAARPH